MATWLSMTNTNIHYVYCHMRKDTGSVFYIGKGSGNRYKSKSKRNSYWKNIVQKTNGFDCQIVASSLSEEEAYNFERVLIQSVQSQTDIKLSNLIGGGRGGSFNPSDETREKQRQAKIGKSLSLEVRKKLSEIRKSQPKRAPFKQNLSDEQRKKVSERAKNRVWTDETCRKISISRIGKKHSEETKLKISASKKGRIVSDEEKQRVSVAVKQWWATRKEQKEFV